MNDYPKPRTGTYKRFSVLVLVGILAFPLSANDTFVTLGAGGLVPTKTSKIVMESEDLEISIHQIRIRYRFRNLSNEDVVSTIAFPLPELGGGEYSHSPIKLPRENQLNFVGFKVTEKGKPVAVKLEWRAFQDGREVTSRIRSVGLSPVVGFRALNAALRKLSASQLKALEQENLIQPEEFSPGILVSGTKGWWAAWTVRAQFYWTQRFPAGRSVELIQTYHPVVGGSYMVEGSDGSPIVENYCGNKETHRQIEEVKRRRHSSDINEIVLWEKRIKYILTTGNNWSGPIRDFHLSISADSPEDILTTCMPGIKRTGPSRYELSRKDFRPDRELDLLLLQTKQ